MQRLLVAFPRRDLATLLGLRVLALLGLRQMNGQAANKKQKGRATPQRSKRVSPVARRQRKPKVIKTPQKKRPSPSARQQRKKKRADMLTTSSATKKTTKTPKTAKSKRKVRVGSSAANKAKIPKNKTKKSPEYYVNPNRIKTETVQKIVAEVSTSAALGEPTENRGPETVEDEDLKGMLETAMLANKAAEEKYTQELSVVRRKRIGNISSVDSVAGDSSPSAKNHYHRHHHHTKRNLHSISKITSKCRSSNSSPAAKRKIVAQPDENGTPPKKMKTKRIQPNRKNVKRSPGSNGMKGLCNKQKHLSFLPFEDARRVVRALKLDGSRAWWYWSKHYRPDNIPSTPDITYRLQGWKGMKDWLGNEGRKRRNGIGSFLPFEKAKQVVSALGLKNKHEWREWSRTKRPPEIPSTPQRTYKDSGWNGLADWLGKPKPILSHGK